MAQPVYGTPWQTLNQPVSEEELPASIGIGAQLITCLLVRFIFVATLL